MAHHAQTESFSCETGQDGLLNIGNRHFKVTVLEVTEDSLRLSFPGKDYPSAGMGVVLEFHDDAGFYYYETEVTAGPMDSGQGIIVRKADNLRRSFHRGHMRIPTDLTAQIRDQVHVRKYNAALMNLSAGGTLVRTDGPFEFDTVIEMFLSLPGEPAFKLLGQVIHVMDEGNEATRLYGIRFLDVDPEIVTAITRYIWQLLPHIYPPRR